MASGASPLGNRRSYNHKEFPAVRDNSRSRAEAMTVEQSMPSPLDEAARIDAVLEKLIALAERGRRLPESTYRLQFHAGFTFRDAAPLADYLHELGISDCYASPYLKARPGSKHGYDISDHQNLNPEIGTDSALGFDSPQEGDDVISINSPTTPRRSSRAASRPPAPSMRPCRPSSSSDARHAVTPTH
jgi:hypothetical protein